MKNRPVYGWIPVDYSHMQDLSIDIKTMPQAFGGYHLLLVIMCDQTNFTIVVPLRDRQTQTIAEALIYRVDYLRLYQITSENIQLSESLELIHEF